MSARTVSLLAALVAIAAPAHAAPKSTPVNIETTPAGAEVTLVEPAPERLLGLTPLKKVKIPVGPVKIRLRLQGYEDKTETLTIGPKETTFNVALVRKILPATLDLSGDANSQGAEVAVDGEVKGKLPIKVSVPPGRHQIVARKAGFVSWEKWAEVTENQTATFEVVLKPQDKPKGSLLLSSSPSGAEVRVNGAPKGKAPQVIENLDPGTYNVELELEGHKPWRQAATVKEGQRETVDGKLEPIAAAPVAAPVGELTVLCDAPKSSITVDGEDKGPPPAKVAALKAGEHIVECAAAGYPKATQVVVVKAGEVKTVQLSPKAAAAATTGAISVVCNVATAKARIGGVEKKVPCTFDNLPPGPQLVEVESAGYLADNKTVAVEATKTIEVRFDLKPFGKLRVTVPIGKRGQVYVAGEFKGEAHGDKPLVLDLAPASYKVEVKEEGPGGGHETRDVVVASGQTSPIDAQLIPPPEPKVVRRSNPTSAHVNEPGKGTVQLGIGIPVIAQATINAGIMDHVAAGIEIRNTAHAITEFELQASYRLVGSSAFAVGAQGGLGGGLGADERNAFSFSAKGIASLLLGDTSSFSFYAHFRYFSDKINAAATKRNSGMQLPIGLVGEFKTHESMNVWLKCEMDFAFPDGRPLYGEVAEFLNAQIRGGAGLTWLFN